MGNYAENCKEIYVININGQGLLGVCPFYYTVNSYVIKSLTGREAHLREEEVYL